jgi:hypothetical protein
MLARAKNVVPCLAVASAHSGGPTRHDYIFYFTKSIYIYIIYIQYKKIFVNDVLLVRQLHPVYLTLLLLGHGFKPHLLHNFLTFYANLIKWTDMLNILR